MGNYARAADAVFAHLTDLHLPILAKPDWTTLMNKRLLGYLSWRRKRKDRHKLSALEAVAAEIRKDKPAAALITGDIVNIALPEEFRDAERWLEQWLSEVDTAYAPGNHDTYVAAPWDDTIGLLQRHMIGRRRDDSTLRAPQDASDFPYVQTYGSKTDNSASIAVIAANSSPPTAPGLASGALGQAQIDRIEASLESAGKHGQFRILLLHHPLNDQVVSERKALRDRRTLQQAISRAGVELVLHGHAHVSLVNEVATPTGNAPVLGGGSASHPRAEGRYRSARYNRIAITREADAWSIVSDIRELDPAAKKLATVQTLTFKRPLL
ncbi:MAG: metallophosphoesterase [Pseudomonadota bacterium]